MAPAGLAAIGSGRRSIAEDGSAVARQLMDSDMERLCGAGYGERTAERPDHRNGYRSRLRDTRASAVDPTARPEAPDNAVSGARNRVRSALRRPIGTARR